MNGSVCEEKTPVPVTLSGERKQSVQKNDIQIPGATANQIYESVGTAEYAPYFSGGIVNNAMVPDINPVAVILRWSVWECRQMTSGSISRSFRPNIKV